MEFKPATKTQARARVALIGPSGAGKTYSALAIATHLGTNIGLIDTEHGTASKYADDFSFNTLDLRPPYEPQRYVEAIHAAEKAGFDVLVVDSLSHAWTGVGGALDMHDRATAADRSGNSYTAWRQVTPHHNALIEAMLACSCHLIVTMRAKQAHVQEKDEKTGRTVIRKLGMEAVQREGMEYEFDVVGDMDMDHRLIVSKTRCKALDAAQFIKPGRDVANILSAWLTDGAPMPSPTVVEPTYEHLERWSRGIEMAKSMGLDHTMWTLPDNANDAQVMGLIEEMAGAINEAKANGKVAAK